MMLNCEEGFMSVISVPPVVDKKTSVVLRDGKFDLTTKTDLDSIFQQISRDPLREPLPIR